ncbi:MAG: arginine--tRNA ligase [Chloroflexia bacterium]
MILTQDEHRARQALNTSLRELGKEPPSSLDLRRIPFSGKWGLATSVCMRLSQDGESAPIPEGLSKKEARKLVEAESRERSQSLASEVADRLRGTGLFSDVEALNGYVNMYFDPAEAAVRLLRGVRAAGAGHGRNDPKTDKVMVEHAQPNTHKLFHIGHLRNACLGDALCNILDFDGYPVVRATYIGDIGSPVVKWLWGYTKWHDGEQPTEDLGRWMETIYVEANTAIKENPEYEAEYRDVFARWDRQEPEVVELWRRTREWSLEYFQRIFAELGVVFDVWFYESEFEGPGKQVVQDLLAGGVAVIDDGAPIVRLDEKLGLDKEQYRTLLLQRSDGTLYQTKELALTRAKFDDYHVARLLVVVDVRQTLYFQQVFKTLEIFGYEQAAQSAHVPYELVALPTGPMSSREGTTVSYDELADEMHQSALATVREKNPEMPPEQQAEVAQMVSVGAMKFGMLDRDNTRLLVFDRDEALSFDGFSAPYVQYSHARACRILEKAPPINWDSLSVDELSPVEINLLEAVGGLSDAVARAAREYKPLYVVTYVYNLAKVFNEFYRESPVLRADDDLRNFRLALVDATRATLANGLRLLGIAAPEAM